jgi:hypothetical protein
MLKFLVYVSSATVPMSNDALLTLLRKGRAKNEKAGITGMLLYSEGNFMQAIEGPEEAVDQLQKTIAQDPRHKGMLILTQGPLEQRQFNEWSMGFKNCDNLTDEERAAYSTFLNEPFTAEYFGDNPHKAMKLLQTFKKVQG